MATVSIRSVASSCLGVTGTISVYSEVFGYPFGRISRDVRIRQHLERIKGRSINLCTVLVGFDGFNSVWTEARAIRVQHAIDLMREIYAQADLGVRRIFWKQIPPPDSDPFLTVNASEATDLTEQFSCSEDGIDVFWVESVSDADGWSNSDGPCDKDAKGRTGVVLQVTTSDDFAGVLLAHEVGHYLTLVHANTMTNLMGADTNNDGVGELDNNSRNITDAQAEQMQDSCWVRGTC